METRSRYSRSPSGGYSSRHRSRSRSPARRSSRQRSRSKSKSKSKSKKKKKSRSPKGKHEDSSSSHKKKSSKKKKKRSKSRSPKHKKRKISPIPEKLVGASGKSIVSTEENQVTSDSTDPVNVVTIDDDDEVEEGEMRDPIKETWR